MSGLHFWRRGLDLKNRPRNVVGESGPALDLPGPDDLRYGLRISVWLRWFVVVCLVGSASLSSQLRPPCLCRPHPVRRIGAGAERLRALPHSDKADDDVALGARPQRDGRGDAHRGTSYRRRDSPTPSLFCTIPPSPCSPSCSPHSGSALPGSLW